MSIAIWETVPSYWTEQAWPSLPVIVVICLCSDTKNRNDVIETFPQKVPLFTVPVLVNSFLNFNAQIMW